MVLSINKLLDEYKDYSNKYQKIAIEEKQNHLIKIKRGLYETNKKANPFTIANILLSPSYISFETALSYYGMIPERVYAIKSASFKKNKIKEYNNFFGHYIYQDIYYKAFPYDINKITIDNQEVLIASREKALIDMVSVLSPRKNRKELIELLYDDLRIDEVIFEELDKEKMIKLCDYYKSTTVKLLKKYLEKFI